MKQQVDHVKLYKSVVDSLRHQPVTGIQKLPAISQIVAVAKGLIDPADLRISATLRPEESNSIISMVTEDAFLSQVTTETMNRTRKDISVLDITPRQLKRVAQGTEPSTGDLAEPSEHGTILLSLPVQLFATFTLDTLRDNADNPNIITLIQTMLQTTMQNDLTDLGCNGTKDDNSAGFLTLNKGWIQVAQDSVTAATGVKTASVTPGTSGWIDSLGAIRTAADQRYIPTSAFIMSQANADAFDIEIGKLVTGVAAITNQTGQSFLRQPIIPCRYMPDTKILYTPIKNLVMGLSSVIHRDAAYNPRKRALEVSYDMACDYEVAVKHATVLATVS